MSVVVKSELSTSKRPMKSDFTPEELKLFDIDGYKRHNLKITFTKLTTEVEDTLRDIAFNQFALPMKYLKPVPDSYEYVCQKSQISGKEKDIKNAAVTIQPLNPDFVDVISKTPINQALPLGTIVTIDVETPYHVVDGKLPERKGIWAKNLRTVENITSIIMKEKPNSTRQLPWCWSTDFGVIDIGSKLSGKFEVAQVDTNIMKSFQLFLFRRPADRPEFTLSVFNYYNTSPIEVLELIKKQPNIHTTTPKIIDEIISKTKVVDKSKK